MKIKTRILISNALMIFALLMGLMGVANISVRNFEPRYNEAARRMMSDDLFKVDALIKGFPTETVDFPALEGAVEMYDYRIIVLSEDKVVYSGLSRPRLTQITEWLKANESLSKRAGMMLVDNTTVLRTVKTYGDQAYTVLAIHDTGEVPPNMQTPFQQFRESFWIMGVLAILLFMVVSQIFTRRLAKRIIAPMDALAEGAKRIEQGDFETLIAYQGEKEFETVVATFNQMQLSLKAAQEKNIRYEKARTDMVASISHDLRTPLTSIKGYIKGLQDGVAQTTERQQQYLSVAYQKACDMDELLRHLFYFSKLETDDMPLYKKKMDLSLFARQFVESARDDLMQKQAQITFRDSGEKLFAMIDQEQMKRVLGNVVDNALNYAKADELVIEVSAFASDGMAQLVIKDNGIGVPEEQLPLLFDRFYRGDAARGHIKGSGSGLGLYIVKYIVEAHSGTVSAHAAGGLAIEISLPLIKEEA